MAQGKYLQLQFNAYKELLEGEDNAPPPLKLLAEQRRTVEHMILKLQVEATIVALSDSTTLAADLTRINVRIDLLTELLNQPTE